MKTTKQPKYEHMIRYARITFLSTTYTHTHARTQAHMHRHRHGMSTKKHNIWSENRHPKHPCAVHTFCVNKYVRHVKYSLNHYAARSTVEFCSGLGVLYVWASMYMQCMVMAHNWLCLFFFSLFPRLILLSFLSLYSTSILCHYISLSLLSTRFLHVSTWPRHKKILHSSYIVPYVEAFQIKDVVWPYISLLTVCTAMPNRDSPIHWWRQSYLLLLPCNCIWLRFER